MLYGTHPVGGVKQVGHKKMVAVYYVNKVCKYALHKSCDITQGH